MKLAVLFRNSLSLFKHTVIKYRRIYIFKMISRAELLYEEPEGTQQEKREASNTKTQMPPSNNLRELAFLRGGTAKTKSYQQTRIDDWEHLTKLTAI